MDSKEDGLVGILSSLAWEIRGESSEGNQLNSEMKEDGEVELACIRGEYMGSVKDWQWDRLGEYGVSERLKEKWVS